jgi:hypothetical protein
MLKKILIGLCFATCLSSLVWADSLYDTLCPSSAPLSPALAAPAASAPGSTSDTQANPDAAPTDREWSLTLSPVTHHWEYNPEHRHVYLGSLERFGTSDRFCGVALFRNSFGQPSTYVYAGKEWPHLMDSQNWFAKVSAGLIYGYKGPYRDKIPFDEYGIAPAIIPSLGYRISHQDSLQLILLGNSALMFAYGHDF